MQSEFCKAKGYEADADVIYGDTDSVMVNFKVADIGRAMQLGRDAAALISSKFPPPVKLEFEKVCGACWVGGGRARAPHNHTRRRRRRSRPPTPHQTPTQHTPNKRSTTRTC